MEEGAGGLRWWGLLEGKDGRKRGEGTGSRAVECGGRLPGSAWEVGDAVENGRDAADRGSRAVECGGRLPGSAREVGDAVENGRDADHLAIHKDADNVVGQHFLSTYGGIQPISSAVGRGIDAKFPAEPEDGVRFSSEISEYEMQTSSIVSLASYAIGGGISKQKDIVSELDDVAVTEEDVMTNTIGTNETSEDSPVKVDEFGLSRQDNKRTKIDERHSASDHEIESNQQKKLMVTNPIDNFPIIVEPIESFTEKSVGTPDIVQPEHQLDSTPDHWAIPKEENNVVGPYYPSTEISSSTSSTVLPHEEGGNNTLGWKGTLLKYSISPPASMDNTYLMSKILLLHSLDKTLDVAPKNLRLAFDEHVNGIGNHIKDDVAYVQVISKILSTELTPKYDFSEMFSDDLVLKIEEANRVASSYREKELTLYDRQIILGALDQLPIILAQIESLVMQIKLRLETVKKFDENEKEPDENSHGKNEDGREDEKLEKEKKPVWLHVMRLLVFGGIVVAMVSSGGTNDAYARKL